MSASSSPAPGRGCGPGSGSGSSSAPVLLAALRTPVGTAGHGLAGVDAAGLAAPVLAALVASTEVPGLADRGPDEVLLGNCMGPGGNPARVASLAAGLPASVPATTLDGQCGSGLAALAWAAARLRAEPGVLVAGGTESASTAPWRFWPPADGAEPERYDRAPFAPATHGDPDMGVAADLMAEEHGVTRQQQDAYAARSHARAVATAAAGGFAAELVPVAGVVADERPRAGLTAERLARFRPAFRDGGTVTAGNSCGINDGAAAAVLVDAATHRRLGLPGLRVLATATSGHDPRRPGYGLVPAARAALAKAGLDLAQMDVVELNEAFAGQVLACCAALELDPERVCVEGGALALGHPWGASGAVLAVRLFTQLVLRGTGRYGLAAIAVGGGQGVAMVVEACR